MQIIVCKLVHLLLATGNGATKPKPGAVAGTAKMLRHAGRIMKLTAILLLGACLQVAAAGYGQKITLSERNVPIEKVFKKIQQQTDYKFLYTSQLLEGVSKVTVVVKDASVEKVLDLVLKDMLLDYEVSENTVVIRPKNEINVKETTDTYIKDAIDEVRGIITDENGLPTHNVNIVVKGTNKGTTTNIKGEFVLRNVPENSVLLITSIGYDQQEIFIEKKKIIKIQLKVAIGNLDELQVTAYGVTSKRFNTGNISTVKAVDIEKQPIQNVLLTLQGRVPGITIEQATGLPGTAITVRIQGYNSILGGNEPLYVVDGVPFPSKTLITTTGSSTKILGEPDNSQFSPGGTGNPLAYINPADIESIDVLKDADATSIYGSRAANGAILITTKKGKAGQTKFDINVRSGWGKVARTLKVMNTDQYLEMRKEAFKNDQRSPRPSSDFDITVWDSTRNTDWVNMLLGGTSQYNNVTGTLSGGNMQSQYLIGGTYTRETTVFPGQFNDQRGSLHWQLNSVSRSQVLKVQFTGSYLADNNRLPFRDFTNLAYSLPPNAPRVYNDDGTLNWEPNSGISTWSNPFAQLYNKYQNKTENLIGSALIGIRILPSLELSTRLGYNKLETNELATTSLLSMKPEVRLANVRSAEYTNSTIKTFIIEPQLNYHLRLNESKFEILLGVTIQQSRSFGQSIYGSGHPTEESIADIHSATLVTANSSVEALYKYNAAFARISYNLKEKYIVNFNMRRDGSSHFGPENRFHNFGSIGSGWIFSKEKFVRNMAPAISFGKIKASYGTTGNDQIGDYRYMDLYTSQIYDVPYQGSNSIVASDIPNPYLQWEDTKKVSFGFDLGILNDALLISAIYARNRSSNQLIPYALPSLSGFNSVIRNFPATTQNESWEFSFSSINLRKKNFQWTSNLNFTIPRNKLIDFSNLEESTYSSLLVIGKSINIIHAYHFLGVNPISGIYEFSDLNGNATSTPTLSDKYVLINPDPKFYGGFSNTFTFKGIQLDFLFQFIKQRQSTNAFFAFGSTSRQPGFPNYNQPLTVLKRWQKPGDVAYAQQYSTSLYRSQFSNASQSDAGYVDASFIRLKNISLSYKVLSERTKGLKIRDLVLNIQAQNLFTITNFKGVDPENQSNSGLGPLRMIAVGIQAGF